MKKLYIYLLSIFLVMASAIVISYAWFANSKEVDPEITGYSKSAYFASGDGTAEKPFLITRNRHLYNLAWLQYLGQFNELDTDGVTIKKQYYFKLGNNIDMSNMALPSIGTELHPFVGNFNGNGKVISNLTVLNKLSDFTITPTLTNANNNNFGSVVGMFGVVGNLKTGDYNYTSTVVSISNFYIDNLSVRSSSTSTLIGLLAGYVNGNVSTIGIHYSNLSLIENAQALATVGDNKAISNFGLIGYYNSGQVEWADNPGAGQSFGTTIDIETFYTRMESIYNLGTTLALEMISTGTLSYGIKRGYYMPIITDSAGVENEIPSSINTGYMTGELKLYELADNAKNSDVFYVRAGGSGQDIALNNPDGTDYNDEQVRALGLSGINTAEQFYSKYERVPQKIKDNTIIPNKVYGVRLNNAIDMNNKVIIPSAVIAGVTYNNAPIPYNSLWFAPQIDGDVQIAVYANDNASAFTIFECNRSTMGDYSSGITGLNNVGSSLLGNHTEMTKLRWYYYAFPVEAGKEYIIADHNSSKGAYLSYLDIGMSSGSGDIESTIEKVDFVYAIEDEIGNITYNDLNDESKVVFEITGNSTAAFNIYFRRKKLSDTEILVLYFIENELTGLNVNKLGSGSASKATNSDVDTKIS